MVGVQVNMTLKKVRDDIAYVKSYIFSHQIEHRSLILLQYL